MINTQLKDRLIALGMKTSDEVPRAPTPLQPHGRAAPKTNARYERAVTVAATGVGSLSVALISLRGGEQWVVETPDTQTVINDRAEAVQAFNEASRTLMKTLPLHPTKAVL